MRKTHVGQELRYSQKNYFGCRRYFFNTGNSFLMLRRIKAWLQSRMAQIRLNSVSILYDNKFFLNDTPLPHVANEFNDHLPDRKNFFGSFTAKYL